MNSIFCELSYLKDILISCLLDPMNIFKNVPYYIFQHILGKNNYTLYSRRDIALSCTKFNRINLCPNQENETYEEAPWISKKRELD